MNPQHDAALRTALGAAVAGMAGAPLANLEGELRLMMRRAPPGSPEVDMLLLAHAAVDEARATRH